MLVPFLAGPRPSAVTSRLIWPLALILTLTLGLIVMSVFWSSEGANEIAAERQRVQIVSAVNDELNGKVRQLASLIGTSDIAELMSARSSPGGMASPFGARAARFFGLDSTFLITAAHDLVAGTVDGRAVDNSTFEALLPMMRGTVRDLEGRPAAEPSADEPTESRTLAIRREFGAARLVEADGKIYAVIAVPIPAGTTIGKAFGAATLAIAFQHWNQAVLDALAARETVGRLRMVQADAAGSLLSIPVGDAEGRVGAHLEWSPDRPGDMIRERLVPMTLAVVFALLVFSAFMFAHVQRVAVNLARSEERAQKLAGHDALSGLPNRLLFSDRLDRELARMKRSGHGLSVMVLDLDRFKEVNDTYGHEAGDDLIKQVAYRLSDLLRGADTLARFGGDEFAIIQTGVGDPRDAEALARRILEAITHPFDVPGGTVTVGISIGIALSPENGVEREALLRLADAALYQAKNDGRNRYSFFERQMDETLRVRKIVEDDLRAAIAQDQLALYYQPQVSADGETIVGVEALVRWPHPRHGLIAPGQFISIAEERGLIIPLGDWVLRRACEDAKRWPHLKVAVNVSPIQFRHKDFVEGVKRVIEASGIDPTRLEIELTEGVVVDDADAAEAAMMNLRALGVRLALDDFGTGYSSLIYLRRFAFDKIKIDRSFLESMEPTGESAILVHSVVHLGRALGLTVTAEGVETKEQHRFLQAVGCHELQGYLFSRPVPAEEIERMLGAGPMTERTAAA